MVLSFEMAVNERAPQKSIQLISIHANALTFTRVGVLPSKWIRVWLKTMTEDQFGRACQISLPTLYISVITSKIS